jgi:L-lactate dehydrogenase complex protein LldF
MTPEPVRFHKRVEDALANKDLAAVIRRTTTRSLDARTAALANLAGADDWRDRARAIRADTLAHLDRYLEQFIAAVEARGGHVHYAQRAQDATDYVCRLAQARGVKVAVKSKSMISEEIELNHHLEAAGIKVVETDLGEFVVQVANDRPSHIVAPIIHKSREDVAQLFREKLSATDTDVSDVSAMTQFARRLLRGAFLRADIGISGVNFGVADTGSLCICTNEGNGRLTTTVPRVHVAMMGIERLVPNAAALGVMLQVLARSSTGQTLTVYTNILSGPRRPGEADGPDELHVVLLDNGRTGILGGELAEILYCIRCGACLNTCPVYQQIGGHAYGSVYPGPVGAVLTPGLLGLRAFHELPEASTLCGACREVCPVRIDIPRLLLQLRAQAVAGGFSPVWITPGIKVLRWIGTRPWMFRRAGRMASRAGSLLATGGWIGRLPGHLSAWTRSRDFPAPARRSFMDRWQDRDSPKR